MVPWEMFCHIEYIKALTFTVQKLLARLKFQPDVIDGLFGISHVSAVFEPFFDEGVDIFV